MDHKKGYKIKNVEFDKPKSNDFDASHEAKETRYQYEITIRHRDTAIRGELKLKATVDERNTVDAIREAKKRARDNFDIEIREEVD